MDKRRPQGLEKMTGRLRIKVGNVEIEWEGEVAFLKAELPQLIATLLETVASSPNELESDVEVHSSNSRKGSSFTTGSIAAKLRPKSATELFRLALYKLHDSDRMETASRSQIHDEMKQAPKFYRPSMLKQFVESN